MFSGTRLKEIKKGKRYTLAALAKETGLHWTTLSGYERGKREPSANALRKIALALSVNMDDFFENGPLAQRPLGLVIEGIEKLAERRRLSLLKGIYPLFLFQEFLGLGDAIFTNILLALARGRVIELIPVFPCDIKEGMKVYQIPDLGNKKYYSFTIIDSPMPEPDQRSAAKAGRRTRKGGGK